MMENKIFQLFSRIIGGLKIKTKFLLFFLITFLITSGVSILIVYFLLNKTLTNELLGRITVAANSLVVNLTDPVLTGDKGRIVDLIFNEKFSRKDIAYVMVIDEKNQIIGSTLSKAQSETLLHENLLFPGENTRIKSIQYEAGEDIYDIAIGLEYNKGILRTGYYKKQIDNAVMQIVLFLILGLLVSLSIAIALVFLFVNMIVKPIKDLERVAAEVAAGNLQQRAGIKSKDEIGFLGSTINQMLDSIEKSEKILKEEKNQNMAIISSMGEGLFVLDKDLNIVLINKVAENLLGVLAEEAVGKEVRDIIRVWKNEKELSTEDLPVVRMLKTGKTVVIAAKDNYYYHSVSGKAFPVEIVTAPLIKDNHIVGGVILFRDVTVAKEIEKEREFARVNLKNALESVYIERDAVREQKNKLETILNSIGDAVFAVDAEKKIIILNPMAERITGFGFREVKGHIYNKYLKFTDEITKKEKSVFIDEALKGKQVAEDGRTILEAKGKKSISISKTAAPIRNSKEEIVGCIVIFRDITAEREIERMRSDFISVVSHQLRTPLSAMKWFAEILSSGDVGALKPKQKDLIKNIYLSNQGMIDLVNQMLAMSRIEENRLAVNPEEINLETEIKSILKRQKLFLDKKRQKLNFTGLKDKNLKIITDKVLLKNIIDNLVSNASRYTPLGGEIKVTASARGENHLLFKVSDNGIGIPKEEQYKVFKKFFRAKNGVEYEANGTGLGLYIVKSILDIIGGKIWFESPVFIERTSAGKKENKGTAFYFTMPVDISKIGEK